MTRIASDEVSIAFRRASAADADAILEFWKASGASPGVTDDVRHLRDIATNARAVLLLAIEGEEIVGSLLGTYDGWRGNLYRLVVRPDHRRRGIARELVRRVEKVFAEWGVKRVSALVEHERTWATQFWTAVGYPKDERIARHMRMLDGEP